MYQYTGVQWLFFFYFYCFFGWCFESAYVSLRNRRLINRGFMRGPFLPLYGSGALMMLIVSGPVRDSLILTYIMGCIGATILEYVTGVAMEALFKVRYWDYSNQKFNFRGYICLSSSLAWGGLTILMTEVVHAPVERLVLGIPENLLTVVTFALTVILVADFTLSFKEAIDLRDVLAKMEETKEELGRLQKRLDVLIAVSGEERKLRKQEREERTEDLIRSIEARLLDVKEKLRNGVEEYSESTREELFQLRMKFKVNVENRKSLQELKKLNERRIFRSNPTMVSRRFKEALQELKEALKDR
ncbi:MAG: hypothetical protein MR430_02340 [Lachnospiraceae bacterium]|nr:hypothetical protein [Lachnospiraceae bacterium]